MSIGTGEAEANSRPGSSPDDDGEDKLPEAIYRRERDMENSPSEPATLSGDVISPVVEPEKRLPAVQNLMRNRVRTLADTPSSSKIEMGLPPWTRMSWTSQGGLGLISPKGRRR